MGRNRKPPSAINGIIPRTKPPFDQEKWEKAVKATREQHEADILHLNEIQRMFAATYSQLCPLTYFSLVPALDGAFAAYIFFRTDSDIERAQREGLVSRMAAFIGEQLERFGRGDQRTEIMLKLKSDESIKRIPGAYRFRRRDCEVSGPGVWPS